MQKAGWLLLIVGCGVVVGYWAYYVLEAVFSNTPGPLLAGIIAMAGGILVLFASTVRDRINERKNERYEEMKR